MSDEPPKFYTPEAETADTVQCLNGHETMRETALFVGQMIHATWGCAYCSFTDSERQIAMRSREITLKGLR